MAASSLSRFLRSRKSSGFTLVELAIVLVIVGLLIAGILVAQSMIQTAKIQSFVKQISSFDVAIENFVVKFNGLPGDGNISGQINSSRAKNGYTECQCTPAFSEEVAYFWNDLSVTGHLKTPDNKDYSPTPNYTLFPLSAPNAPEAVIGKNAGILVYGDSNGGMFYSSGLNTGPANAYIVSDFTSTTTGPAITGAFAITGSEYIAFDRKIDDFASVSNGGRTGNVRCNNLNPLNLVAYAMHVNNYSTTPSAGSTPVCNLVIRMGISTGQLR